MSFWSVLGLEATRDLAVIKRAYAARLKDCHPEDDPAGFQKLRAAYESAMRYATPRKPQRFTASIDPKVRRKQTAPPVSDEIASVALQLVSVIEPVETAPPAAETQTAEPPAPLDGVKRTAADPVKSIVAESEVSKASTPPVKTAAEPVTPPVPRARPEPVQRPALPVQPDPVLLRAQHDARCRALARMVAKGAGAGTMQTALAELLMSEPMESVGVHGRTERWLTELIVDNTPRSDPLVAPSIKYFAWRADRLGRDGDVSRRVLARGDDLVFLDGLRRRRSEHANAWRALNAKPTRMRVLLNCVTLSLAGGVRNLLKLIRQERPSLMDEIDPDGLAWWDHHLARPQIPAELGFTAFLGVFVSTLVLPASRWFGPMPWALLFSALASFGVVAAVLGGGLYGVARPRHVWMTSKAFGAPVWKRLGWAPATLALVLVAALAPASPWVTPAIAIAVLWLVYWAVITGEPNRNPSPRYPWPVRALFNFAYLGIFWMIMAAILPPARWMQMSLPIVGGMVAFTWGAGSLYDAVRDEIGEKRRRGLAWFLAAVSMLAFVAVASVHDHAAMAATAAALLAVAVFTHKTLDGQLGSEAWRWRAVAMLIGWVVWFIVLTAILGPRSPDRDFELRLGMALLTGPVIVAGVMLLAPLPARRRSPKLA